MLVSKSIATKIFGVFSMSEHHFDVIPTSGNSSTGQFQSWISIRLMLTFFVRFVIFWHAQNLKNIPFKIVALEIKWIRYFSMNLWKKLFITNNFLYLLIEKIYGWTTIPNNTGWYWLIFDYDFDKMIKLIRTSQNHN